MITQIILENYDDELAKERDTKSYRDKGKRETSIKTVYGSNLFSESLSTEQEDGRTAHIYLLDQAMQMEKIGLISTNLAEKIALTVTESPYRVSADIISDTCGQTISMGCLEPDPAARRTDLRRGEPRSTADGSRPGRRAKSSRILFEKWMVYAADAGFPP